MTGDEAEAGASSDDLLYTTGPPEDPDRYGVSSDELSKVRIGGEGLLYEAMRTATGERVALKLLTNTPVSDYERVAERAALFTLLDDPGLMRQLETFVGPALAPAGSRSEGVDDEDVDILYSVAAWVDGVTLTDATAGSSPHSRLVWITEIADALAALHAPSPAAPLGLVHRDVKPSNIRVRPDGRTVLVDFGVARQADSTDMTEGVGTYRWRAPEVLTGSHYASGQSVDTWGLGAVAHWLLLGSVPELDGAAAAQERLASCIALVEFPRGKAIAAHIAALLHTDPSKRPGDLRRWADALRRMCAGKRTLVEAVRETALPLAVAAAVITVGWGAYIGFIRPPDGGQPATTDAPSAARIGALPSATRCDGIAGATMSIDPPAVQMPQTVTLELDGPPLTIDCNGAVDLSLVVESISLTVDGVSCATPPMLPGTGKAELRWSDGLVTPADISMTPESGILVTRIHSSTGAVQLDASTTASYTELTGACDTGGVTAIAFDLGSLDVAVTWNGDRPGD